MIIDAHHHLWEYESGKYPWMTEEFANIRRRFGPEDLHPLLRRTGVNATVLVQTQSSLEETKDFLAVAARTAFIAGVVGWVDLTSDQVKQTIAELRAAPSGSKLVGIRHQVHDEPDAAWLLREDVDRGLRAVADAGLAFDLLVRPRELPAAYEAVTRHPNMHFIVDHLAKPPIAEGGSPLWDMWLPRLARLPNTYCKVSGLVTEADWRRWSAGTIRPYVEHALTWFGADRLLFGSDWPVCLVAAEYAEVFALAQQLFGGLSERERDAVFATTAVAAYGLDLRACVDDSERFRPPGTA